MHCPKVSLKIVSDIFKKNFVVIVVVEYDEKGLCVESPILFDRN